MPPKFQSSFIPKGPAAASAGISSISRRPSRDIISLLGTAIFAISVVVALGTFLYKVYLKYDIAKMGAELESARATLASDDVQELINLNNRIVSTQELLQKHTIISSIFEFLESSTLSTVSFNNFSYSPTANGLELNMRGQANSYAALALQSDLISQSSYFKNSVFSELSLDERGNVKFSLNVLVDRSLVSYSRVVEALTPVSAPPPPEPVSTSTTTPAEASDTTTPN